MLESYKKADLASPVSLPAQIKEDILIKIKSGVLKPGERILSETKLAEAFGVSRITARQALMELISEGMFTRIHGRGTFVAEKPRSASSKSARPVMVIVPNLRTSFYHEVISGLERILTKNNYELLLRSVNEDPIEERNCLEKAVGSKVSGIVLAAENYSYNNLELLQKINKTMPFAAVDVLIKGLESDLVVSDDRKGGYLAAKHLIELGHGSIVHLAGPKGDSSAEGRTAGYFDALSEYGIKPRHECLRFTNWHFDEGYYEAKKFFMNPKNEATAVFACNDEVGAGAYRALLELGMKVPDDAAVAGYGNLACGRFLDVPLTTVDQSAPSIGKAVGKLLIQKIEAERKIADHRTVKIPTELIIRDSCGIKGSYINNAGKKEAVA